MGNVLSRLRREIGDVVRNCRARDEEEDIKTIISDYSTLERDRQKCAEKSPNVQLHRFDSDTGEEWKSMTYFASQSQHYSHSSPCMQGGTSKSDISSLCSTPQIVPFSHYSLTASMPSTQENSSYNLFHDLNTSVDSDNTEILTKAGLKARYTLMCPDKESVHENLDKQVTAKENSSISLDGLEQRQEKVLNRLGVLQKKVEQLQKKYNINTPSSARSMQVGGSSVSQPAVLEQGKLHDIVVNADPLRLPYSLVVLYEQLKQKFNVLAQTHVHSSVVQLPENLTNIFKNGQMQSRKAFQLGLTVIWKKVEDGPTLIVDPTRQVAIEGEVNIARYLIRLLDKNFDSGNILEATQIDEWLDKAQDEYIYGSNKERAAFLRTLNAELGKNDWLVGSCQSFADLIVWSVLQQAKQVNNVPANIKKWINACNNDPCFSLALKILS